MSVAIVALRLALIAVLIKNRQGYYQADGTARQDKKKRIHAILIAVTTIVTILDLISLPKKFGIQTDFDRPRRNKAFGDKVKPNTGFDKFGGKSRPKAVEEIFFCQATR